MTCKFSFVKDPINYYESEIIIDVSAFPLTLYSFYEKMCSVYPNFKIWFDSSVKSFCIDKTSFVDIDGYTLEDLKDINISLEYHTIF